ncbi:arginine--tRNA ligase [Patescibacteria group bacterium]|nr:arginine--tRNA ligase [Patescibacteria group bacterium]
METAEQQIIKLIHKSIMPIDRSLSIGRIEIACPKNQAFGDYSTNIALSLAKKLKKKPLNLADDIVQQINKANSPLLAKIETAEPGFINFTLSNKYLINLLTEILKKKHKFCLTKGGDNKKIQIEFISANPTGPLTVGNARGGYLGDVLGNVMKSCGYKITKEYLINDAGSQIENLGHSILKNEQAVYQGEYIDNLHDKIKEADPCLAGQQAAKKILNNYIKKTVRKKMNIEFDVWFSEQKEIREKKLIPQIIKWLRRHDYVYEKDGALWFKSTSYGDDKDRVLIRSSGEPTYFAQDFAYHKNKFDRGFDQVINIWGADHHGDVKRLQAAADVLGHKNKLKIILTQFVSIIKNGQEVRMSKRAGNSIYIDDLINEVSADVARFYFLQYSAATHINFDLNLAKERSEKNPVYYVQYAYARICSILRQKEIKKIPAKATLEFQSPPELSLIKELVKLPDLLVGVSQNYQVQNLTQYAINLSDKFHQFYAHCRVINNGKVNWSRVKLIQAAKIILKSLFDILGISAPEKM